MREGTTPTLVASFFADHAHGEVVLSEERSEYALVTLEEAKKYDFISGICQEIELVDRHLKGNPLKGWESKDILKAINKRT